MKKAGQRQGLKETEDSQDLTNSICLILESWLQTRCPVPSDLFPSFYVPRPNSQIFTTYTFQIDLFYGYHTSGIFKLLKHVHLGYT